MPAKDRVGYVSLPYLVNFHEDEIQLFNRNYLPLGDPVKLAKMPDYRLRESIAWSPAGHRGPMDGGYQALHDIWTAYLYDGRLLDDADWHGYFHRLRILWQWESRH